MFRLATVARRNLLPPAEASAYVFGNRIGDGRRSGWKDLHVLRAGPSLNLWYDFPPSLDKMRIPGLPSEVAINRFERKVRRMRRGLMPVRKHEGKRQQAKKGTSKAVATPKAPAAAATADRGIAKG